MREMLDFGGHLAQADGLGELETRYLAGIGRLTGMPARGIYLLDPVTRAPLWSAVDHLDDSLLCRYEEFGRAIDPMLVHALAQRQAAYNLALMTSSQWRASALYRGVARLQRIVHVVEAPLLDGDEVIGTLNFAGEDRDQAAAGDCLRDAVVLGRVVGQAVSTVRERARTASLTRALMAALEESRVAIVMAPATGRATPNRAAAAVLRRIADGDQVLEWALTRPAPGEPMSRERRVDLDDGRVARLRVTVSLPADDSQSLIARLELDTADIALSAALTEMLSPREQEICGLLVEGLTDRQIAGRLQLSPHTVNQHIKRIYAKTDTHSRVSLVRLALCPS